MTIHNLHMEIAVGYLAGNIIRFQFYFKVLKIEVRESQ